LNRILVASVLFLAIAFPASAQFIKPRPTGPRLVAPDGYVSVQDYGATCDLHGDATPGIIAAVKAALALQSGNFVYFPPCPGLGAYTLRTPLEFPRANKWTELYFDAPVVLWAPIIMNDFYILHGNGGTVPPSFSNDKVTNFATFLINSEAAIQIHGKWGVRLENLSIGDVYGPQDGILIDETSGIVTLDNVVVELSADNLTGSPLHIKGGSTIEVIHGRYGSPMTSTKPSIEIETDPNTCSLMGHFKFSDFVLINNGIRVNLDHGCGVFADLSVENIIYQDAGSPLLSTVGLGGSLSAGIFMKNVNVSDGTPNATCLANMGRAWSFQVFNCLTGNNQAITSGDNIKDLEIWSMGSQLVGQASEYVYHGMNGIVSTMSLTGPAPDSAAKSQAPLTWNFPKAPRFIPKPPEFSH